MGFPLDIEFVKRAETILGRKLPLRYVSRMCNNNGGEIVAGTDYWFLYPIFDDSDRKRIKRTSNHIIRETASARAWSTFPTLALAIGENGTGDQLVLLPSHEADRYADEVYWWDHARGVLTKVADSFEEITDEHV